MLKDSKPLCSGTIDECDGQNQFIPAGIHGPSGPRTTRSSSARHKKNFLGPCPVRGSQNFLGPRPVQLFGPWIPAFQIQELMG